MVSKMQVSNKLPFCQFILTNMKGKILTPPSSWGYIKIYPTYKMYNAYNSLFHTISSLLDSGENVFQKISFFIYMPTFF